MVKLLPPPLFTSLPSLTRPYHDTRNINHPQHKQPWYFQRKDSSINHCNLYSGPMPLPTNLHLTAQAINVSAAWIRSHHSRLIFPRIFLAPHSTKSSKNWLLWPLGPTQTQQANNTLQTPSSAWGCWIGGKQHNNQPTRRTDNRQNTTTISSLPWPTGIKSWRKQPTGLGNK